MPLPTVYLKPGKEKALRNRHPWVFSGAVGKEPEVEPGTLVAVASHEGHILAFGHLEPKATLRVRCFHFGSTLPASETDLWQAHLEAAVQRRGRLLDLSNTTGYRLIFAEGDALPGVVCDRYGDGAVLQLRTYGSRRMLEVTERYLQALGLKHLFLKGESMEQKSKLGPETESKWLFGDTDYLHFIENGLKFMADPVNGQKTGFFVDQRPNRERMAHYAKGRRVLECFSYSGGFGVYALKGGAKGVLSLDGSQHALALAEQHVLGNFGAEPRHTVLKADVFDYLKGLEQDQFDLILLDPPAFSKHSSTVERAARGYKELNMKALAKLPSGGLLFTFSCSQHIDRDLFRKILFSAAADIGRPVRILEQLTQGADHPVDIYHPEGEYLKGIILEVD